MKKTVFVSAAAVTTLLAVVGCGTSPSANTASTSNSGNGTATSSSSGSLPIVKVAYMPDIHGAAPIVIGQQEGFFKQAGIDVQPVKFTSGPPEIDAMASGQIDIAYIGPGAMFLAAKGKTNVIAIDSLNVGDMLLARPNSGINNLQDLKGKTIGVPKGTSGEMILDLALKKAGLTSSDVKIVNMDVSSAISAFVSGHIDAVALWNPYTAQIQQQVSGTKVLATDKNFMPQYSFPQMWTVNPAFEKSHPQLVQKFIDALAKSNDWRMQHIDQAVTMTAQYTNAPASALKSQAGTTQWLSSADIKKDFQDGTVDTWLGNLENLFVKTGQLSSVVPAKNFVDAQFYENINTGN
jgi:NitT/TauT family transport system substrate-binding protein